MDGGYEQMTDEFTLMAPVKRRGFTSVEAYAFLKKEFPAIASWTCWDAYGTEIKDCLSRFVGMAHQGSIGDWQWKCVETSYPSIRYWMSDNAEQISSKRWMGALQLRSRDGAEFIVFSFLSSSGCVGDYFFVSTDDTDLLARFAADLQAVMGKSKDIVLRKVLGRDIVVPTEEETLILDETLRTEIEGQVQMFFGHPELYHAAGIPCRRGFLLVGPPGTGKTMMVRRILRLCHSIGSVSFWTLPMGKGTDDDDVERTFAAASHKAPALIVVEDIDSLTTETSVSRAGFLAQLDGLSPRDGVLIVATSNYPEKIDPALAHRPCRFDRVWKFDYPDKPLRLRYLMQIAGLKGKVAEELANRTHGWSFAYLNELKVTATLMALQEGRTKAGANDIRKSLNLISAQHKSAKKGHEIVEMDNALGFAVA